MYGGGVAVVGWTPSPSCQAGLAWAPVSGAASWCGWPGPEVVRSEETMPVRPAMPATATEAPVSSRMAWRAATLISAALRQRRAGSLTRARSTRCRTAGGTSGGSGGGSSRMCLRAMVTGVSPSNGR